MQSKLFRLGQNDFVKGLFMAVGAAVFGLLSDMAQRGGLHFDLALLEQVRNASEIAFFTYMTKQFFTDENGKLAGKYGGNK